MSRCGSHPFPPIHKYRHLKEQMLMFVHIAENFDRDLEMFLARYFPKEVKGKLRDNQRASNLDVYGEIDSGCCMM